MGRYLVVLVGYGENNAITGFYKTCTTGLHVLLWAHQETVEQPDEMLDPVLQPNNDCIGDTIPDLEVDLQPTSTFILPTRPNLPIEVATPIPAPRDSDGDGIADDQDRCPVERGVPQNNGCPLRRGS